MANLSGKPRADYVKRMFASLAPHYDTANHWMTWWQDVRWRRQVLNLANLPVGGRILDIGTGTGDLAMEAKKNDQSAVVVGADFTPEMMRIGREKPLGDLITWITADALALPFAPDSFNAVVSGYLLRNVTDVHQALIEQYRVLKPGGHVVSLDTTPTPSDLWHLPARFYIRFVIPFIGWIAAGIGGVYNYLPESTQRFLTAKKLGDLFRQVGYSDVHYRCFMGSTMAIHYAKK